MKKKITVEAMKKKTAAIALTILITLSGLNVQVYATEHKGNYSSDNDVIDFLTEYVVQKNYTNQAKIIYDHVKNVNPVLPIVTVAQIAMDTVASFAVDAQGLKNAVANTWNNLTQGQKNQVGDMYNQVQNNNNVTITPEINTILNMNQYNNEYINNVKVSVDNNLVPSDVQVVERQYFYETIANNWLAENLINGLEYYEKKNTYNADIYYFKNGSSRHTIDITGTGYYMELYAVEMGIYNNTTGNTDKTGYLLFVNTTIKENEVSEISSGISNFGVQIKGYAYHKELTENNYNNTAICKKVTKNTYDSIHYYMYSPSNTKIVDINDFSLELSTNNKNNVVYSNRKKLGKYYLKLPSPPTQQNTYIDKSTAQSVINNYYNNTNNNTTNNNDNSTTDNSLYIPYTNTDNSINMIDERQYYMFPQDQTWQDNLKNLLIGEPVYNITNITINNYNDEGDIIIINPTPAPTTPPTPTPTPTAPPEQGNVTTPTPSPTTPPPTENAQIDFGNIFGDIAKGLGDITAMIASLFEELPKIISGITRFISAVFPFLPGEFTMIIMLGLILIFVIGIIKR